MLVLVQLAGSHRTGQLGLVAVAVGMVLNIRAFIGELEARERRAFDLGRQIGANSDAEVKRLH
jgi:hypothetical protein